MYSLQKIITRNLVINMIVVMSVLLIIMYFSMQHLLRNYIVTRLQHDAESLITVMELNPQQRWSINPLQMSTVYDRVRSGHYYHVKSGNQVITSRSLFDADFPVQNPSSPTGSSYIIAAPGEEQWLVWVQQMEKQNQPITLWVAEDIQPLQTQMATYTLYAIVLVLFITLLLILLQQRTLKKAFHIFEILRQNLTSIRHRETERTGIMVPNEILPLVHEIEMLVDQLRLRIERTRHAIGNLAHELKRPLQLLSLQQEDKNDEAAIKPLQEIKDIIERELRRAKISGHQTSSKTLDLAEELPYMTEMMGKMYPHIKVQLHQSGDLKTLKFDRDDMLELIGNLLDNACKFARQNVQLSMENTLREFKLEIEDDGQGLNPDQMKTIQNRGLRLDENTEGHGLGLSICSDIIDSYQGTLNFSSSQRGGLKVSVVLPVNP